MRVGELCNLDLRDLAIDDEEVRETFALGTRPALADRPNSLYVTPDATVGEELNGEARTASNKRKRATVIPYRRRVDGDAETVACGAPDGPSSADPLFVGTAEGWGERLDPQAVRHVVERYAREAGGTVRVAVPPRTSRPTTSGTSSRRISGTGRAIAASSSTYAVSPTT